MINNYHQYYLLRKKNSGTKDLKNNSYISLLKKLFRN